MQNSKVTTSKKAQKKTTSAKASKTAMGNIVIAEAAKALEKSGKKIVAPPRTQKAVKKPVPAEKVADIKAVDDLAELMDKVAASMQGRSAGTIKSAQSLIASVCRQYGVTAITEEVAQRALAESKAAPKSKANLRWALLKARVVSA
jgi:hypothetical protein